MLSFIGKYKTVPLCACNAYILSSIIGELQLLHILNIWCSQSSILNHSRVCGILSHWWFYFFKILFIYFQRETKGGRKREREKHQCVVASHSSPTGDLAHHPGMYPDWESNRQHFDSQPTLSSLSYTSQGIAGVLIWKSLMSFEDLFMCLFAIHKSSFVYCLSLLPTF